MTSVELSKYEYLEHETKFENMVSLYFRVTLLLSAVFLFAGFIIYVFNNGPTTNFDFTQLPLKGSDIFSEMIKFNSVGLMFIGIAILLLIPLGRVVILILHYLENKDLKMALIATLVLTFMLIGIIFNLG